MLNARAGPGGALAVVPGQAGIVLYVTNIGNTDARWYVTDTGAIQSKDTIAAFGNITSGATLSGSNVVSGVGFRATIYMGGYWTTTYHADKITYWKRDLLYPALQFDKAYATPEIPEEDVIGFGPSDRVLFDFVEKTIDEELAMNKKIYANIMTLTSHTPFTMPEEEELLDLKNRYKGVRANKEF